EKETGIKVEVDFTEYAKLKDKQVLELSKPAGDYDVVAWTVFEKGEYVAKGLLAPLSQYFAIPALVDPNYDADDITKAFLYSGALVGGKKGYLPGPTQALYGVPFGPETSILAYRKDIFEQYKLKVPETYDEMLQTAEWISKNVPNMKGIASRGASGHQIVHAYLLHLSPLGGQIFDDKWNPVVNDATGVKAAETLKKIMDNAQAGVNTADFGAETNAFLQGNVAMFVDAHKIAAMSRDPKQSKEYPVIVKQLECAAVDWRPLIPEWQGINAPILGVELSEFATGKKTAKQALDDAAKKIRAEMERAGYYSWTSK
ncbi:MAG: extracellular solute-binding protein, partial [Chloroflexi bacterium]|nr:extracellular solute-binding protein [Chloroflexota bacterium]